ncbi:MAG: hypothetical protein DWI00_03915 [Planctomycetota bacterium]|nr:MAG: hypothetical protein DWI00_03915 [Planctomycetota bacterium]
MPRRLIAVSLMLFAAPIVQAHEGHGHPDHTEGILHYVVNPSHSVVGLYAALVITAAVFVVRRQFKKRSQKTVETISAAQSR